MEAGLDPRVCSRARLARDPRFDGQFFIAVLTTGIYCRPVCRSRTSQEKNVRYFASAAAAAAAGFRPCLRCRPEASPGLPAAAGTRNTVARALRLIAEDGLQEGGVEALAVRLGVGARHLRRLFTRHLGATPSAVAHTRRLQAAKRLLDETALTMPQVAGAAGFGSVRRFNAAIRSVYGRTPGEIRRRARRSDAPPHRYRFRLCFRPPCDLPAMLAYLRAGAIPGVETAGPDSYARTIAVHGHPGWLRAAAAPGDNALQLEIHCGEARGLLLVIERVRTLFDLNADWRMIAAALAADPALGALAARHAGLRVPGCWDGFELAVGAILAQLGPERARSCAARIAERLGAPVVAPDRLNRLFPAAETLARADLTELGAPPPAATAIRTLARAVSHRQISLDTAADAAHARAQLAAIPGIAPATVAVIAMRALRDPDAFPLPELEVRSRAWRPWRAYAAMLLESAGREAAPVSDRGRAAHQVRQRRGQPGEGEAVAQRLQPGGDDALAGQHHLRGVAEG